MADITKCTNQECPMKDSCKRVTAKSSEFQSYENFEFKSLQIKDEQGFDIETYVCSKFLTNNKI